MIENLKFTTDKFIETRKKIGLIVLASDYTIDHEFRAIFPVNGTDYFHARIENSPIITPESLSDMGSKISTTLKLILPGDKLDVVAYACTSATVVLGEEAITKSIRAVHPEADCTTPITAAFEAFDSFRAKNIAVLTPYVKEVNSHITNYIEGKGYNISSFGSFNEISDPVVASIDSQSIISGVKKIIANKTADMVFISCTSIRFMEFIPELERSIGIPVTTSHHAMAWHCMRLAGIQEKMPEFGQLYTF